MTEKVRVNPDQVADYFIWRAHEVGDPISNLKLQKLVYYAQAWHLALNDERLMDANFEAWVHGPVNRALYDRFKQYSWQPIQDNVPPPQLPKEIAEFLEEVWQVYGGFSALDLERMTHSEEPWQKARGDLPADASCNQVIADRDMAAFFRRQVENRSTDGD